MNYDVRAASTLEHVHVTVETAMASTGSPIGPIETEEEEEEEEEEE